MRALLVMVMVVAVQASGCANDCVVPTADVPAGIVGAVTGDLDGCIDECHFDAGLHGVEIRVSAVTDGRLVSDTVTDASGLYEVRLDPGTYQLDIGPAKWPQPKPIVVADGVLRIDAGCQWMIGCMLYDEPADRCLP